MKSNRALKTIFNFSQEQITHHIDNQIREINHLLVNEMTDTLGLINMTASCHQGRSKEEENWYIKKPRLYALEQLNDGKNIKMHGQRDLLGYPRQPYEDWKGGEAVGSPRVFAKATPTKGCAEVCTTVSPIMPGQHQLGILGFSYATASLSGFAPVYLDKPETMDVYANLVLNGMMACAGTSHLANCANNLTGYSLELALKVDSLVTGKTNYCSFNVTQEAGYYRMPFEINRLEDVPFRVSIGLECERVDYLVFSLSLNAMVFQLHDGGGLSIIDLEGMTSTAHKMGSKRPAGLRLNQFSIKKHSNFLDQAFC